MIDTTTLNWRVFQTVAEQQTRHSLCLYMISVCGKENWIECSKCNRVLLKNVLTAEGAHDAWRRSFPPGSYCNG